MYKRQVLSRLNAFLDSELEQVLCFDSTMNAERFAAEKSAIFLILPEEDQTKNFMAGLMIQTLARELFAVADENGGRLPGRVVFFCDELGTMPAFDILPLFSAGRSRGLTMVPIIQAPVSYTHLMPPSVHSSAPIRTMTGSTSMPTTTSRKTVSVIHWS